MRAGITDVLYRLRDMAGMAADDLRIAIADAQQVLDRLDSFASDAEDGAQLIAASDIEPDATALIPQRSGLARIRKAGPPPKRPHFDEDGRDV